MEQSTVLPDTDKAVDFDLVIIGYGMVGAVAALLAAQYKLKIALIEIRKTDDLYVPKAGRIDADVMRIFEQLGFDRKDDNFQALKGARIMNSKGKQLLEFESIEHRRLFIEKNFNFTETRNNSNNGKSFPMKGVSSELADFKSYTEGASNNKTLEKLLKKLQDTIHLYQFNTKRGSK